MSSHQIPSLEVGESPSPKVMEHLAQQLECLDTEQVVDWAYRQYAPHLVLASSFGAEDMVLLDMLAQMWPSPRVFYLDTGLLFPQTLHLIDTARAKYGILPERVTTALSLEQQAQQYGDALWTRDPDRCCRIRKVEPLARHLQGERAWMTGIRRDQTPARRLTPIVTYDTRHHLIKVNPLVNWTDKDVFRYLVNHDVPYNPLHDEGYPSIGCLPCTKPVKPGQDPRSGRWAGQEKTECGLHL